MSTLIYENVENGLEYENSGADLFNETRELDQGLDTERMSFATSD